MNKKEQKLPISRILGNYGYILRYCFRKDARLIIMIFCAFVAGGVGYGCIDTLFIRAFINYLSQDAYTYAQTCRLVVMGTLGLAALMTLERCTESFSRPRMIRLTGMMQQEMLRKVARIDLICYDCDTYYDDFVVSASQLEEMVEMAIYDLGAIGEHAVTVLVLSGLITSLSPMIALFPVLGFLINMVSRFRIMDLEYRYDVEKKTIMRRADYSKRVFYQPEYAKEIKLSHIEVPLEKQFEQAVDETIRVSRTYGWKISVWSVVNWVSVFTVLSHVCVPLYLGFLALVRRSIGLGEVAALNNAQGTIRDRLDAINYCAQRIQKAGLFCERFRRFMDYESQIEKKQGTTAIPQKHGAIEVKDLSFRYDGAERDTLKHVSMRIEPGQRVAFVGENGAGKSTFVKLLMRLYDVTQGSICYGGHDIREYTTDEYRELFGSVFQDYQIYAASVAENVMMQKTGEDDAFPVRQALSQAGFAERLQTLPQGEDTMLTREFSKEGVSLSGGEAQKVAIARMFAKKERMHVAILDEPSSALDPRAEYELNKNMMEKAGDATIIFISHRLSTTRDADCIYMFEHGQIVEQGTHEELMRLHGKYAEMFTCQAKYYQDQEMLAAE